VNSGCSAGLECFALPLVNSEGTSIACTTQQDAEARIAATGASGGVNGGGNNNVQNPESAPAPAPTSADAPPQSAPQPPATPPADAKPFTLQNGQDAQALNAKFATLNANSPCQDGEQACVDGGFAQCVGGEFLVSGCSAPTECFALPLVNKAGTSIACSTEAEAEARIAATGATGGIDGGANPPPVAAPANDNGSANDGSDSSSNEPANDQTPPANDQTPPANAQTPPVDAKPFTLQNGQDAQALNAKFATLNANSPCQDGEEACVDGGFAQCVGGNFVVSPCAPGTTCFALPLVNKAGTSVACSTDADAAARIAATGATGGIQG